MLFIKVYTISCLFIYCDNLCFLDDDDDVIQRLRNVDKHNLFFCFLIVLKLLNFFLFKEENFLDDRVGDAEEEVVIDDDDGDTFLQHLDL